MLLGKYRVEEVLGVGGMGRVVRASHLYLQQSFAIKILLPAMLENPQTVTRFLREAQATSRLKSEHIVRVLDVGTLPDGEPFMVMEYLEGSDLNQILRHHGPQLPGVVCDLMLQACEGLAEAHALGFVHRDIKPSNFYVTRRPDGSMLLKILDFGISKVPVGGEDLTGAHAMLGTPTYTAPEQLRSGREVDRRSDIWSLGVVTYQLLEGRAPFAGETFAELLLKVTTEPPGPMLAQLPPGLLDVIHRCLAKEPNQRPQDVGELARVLAPFASDPIVGAQIAARTTRIVQLRASQAALGKQVMPTSAGGGLVTPEPLSPAPHTPLSWPAAEAPTSIGNAMGHLAPRRSRGRGWLVAGALGVALLAGTGGFVISEAMRAPTQTAASTAPTAPTMPTTGAGPTDDTTATTPSAAKATTSAPTETATVPPAPTNTTSEAKSTPATSTKAASTASTASTAASKTTETKPHTSTKKRRKGLFDSRH